MVWTGVWVGFVAAKHRCATLAGRALIVGALAVALSGCWFPAALNQSGSAMTWSCGPITYSIDGDASFAAMVRAATAEVSQLSGRPLVETAGAALRVRLEWPAGSPSASGWTGIRNDGSHFTGGTVYINPASGVSDPAYRMAVIRHELGHVLGMAHTNDLNSIMYAGHIPVLDYTEVDIAGLRALGSAC